MTKIGTTFTKSGKKAVLCGSGELGKEVTLELKYIGAKIPDAFVVGYGLDYDERYRNLPFVGILKPEVYTK